MLRVVISPIAGWPPSAGEPESLQRDYDVRVDDHRNLFAARAPACGGHPVWIRNPGTRGGIDRTRHCWRRPVSIMGRTAERPAGGLGLDHDPHCLPRDMPPNAVGLLADKYPRRDNIRNHAGRCTIRDDEHMLRPRRVPLNSEFAGRSTCNGGARRRAT